MENLTRRLAGFAARLTYSELPPALVDRLKTCLLDAVGCALHGAALPWAAIVNRWVKAQGGPPEATLWRQGFRGPCANVALGLGVMIHGFDFDDYHNAKIHPGAPVIPAALAVGENLGASGADVLTAMAAGYETMIRISLATGPNASRLKGWHLTGTTGTFGAAAAAGRLLGLCAEEMAGALGLAGTQSAGLWAFLADGAMSKRLHPGRASQSGVMAAFLAQAGFQGPTRILEAADGGFCRATSDAVDLARAVDRLGEEFFSAQVCIKPYACCASSHSAVDAVLELRREHGISADEVEGVCVQTAAGVQVQCGFDYQPAGAVRAQMSLQYIVAVALIEGAALLAQFAEERLGDPRVLDLARRVRIEVDAEIDRLYPERYANRVVITLKDGRRLAARVDHARGSAARPLGFAEVAAKFGSLSGGMLSRERADQVIERIGRLDTMDVIGDLTRLLA
ncbi:MAG: MmgE/PrpD family protein [Desulfobacterales bacterium]|nr:MmgE/PrpD family protein [Desulfobacterales bacterium]